MIRTAARIVPCLALLLAPLVDAEVSTSDLPVLSGTSIHRLQSESVGDDFVLYVRTPPGAVSDPTRRFPVIYTLDGDHTFPQVAAIATQLGWGESVPEAVIVGIGYGTLDLDNGNHRMRDLTPQQHPDFPETGGGAKFLQFMIDEVFPLIEGEYPVALRKRYLFGHSAGGLFALYAYAKVPGQFAGIAAGSPFLLGQLDFLFDIDAGEEPRKTNLFIATGSEEDPQMFVNGLERLRQHLALDWATEGSSAIVLLPGFDHYTSITPAISRGLQAIFAETLSPESALSTSP
jgi:predicted alpha/beta superfamily hydrolase